MVTGRVEGQKAAGEGDPKADPHTGNHIDRKMGKREDKKGA